MVLTTLLAFTLVVAVEGTATVAEFPEVGRVCLSSDEESGTLRRIRDQVEGGERANLSLVGYSDIQEPRARERGDGCLDEFRELTALLTGHERVGVERALQVYVLARKAGIPGFEGPPIVLADGQDDSATPVEGAVVITGRRAMGQGEFSRRVDLVVDAEESATHVCPSCALQAPACPPPEVIVEVTPPIVPVKTSSLRVAGWSQLSVGLAVASLGGALLGAASGQRAASDFASPTERAIALEVDSYRYVRSGGWAIAVGSGLILGGAISLVIARSKRQRRPKRFRESAYLRLDGSVVAW